MPEPISYAFNGAESYDVVPYHGQPLRLTHPASLAAVRRLLGLRAADPHACRVLELGCSDGGNLLPMAEQLPGSTFVGVDYSPVQIDMAKRRAEQLGLSNASFHAISIADIPPDFGSFDYIICHGVFSWVPDLVRDRILDVSAKHLATDGVAYISYNCYPGWHFRSVVRDMMRYHAFRFPNPQKQTQEARLILKFVASATAGAHAEGYAAFLRSEAEMLDKLPDHYLFHEHLEEHCKPYYFHEFVSLAEKHRLKYLGESRLAAMAPTVFGKDAEEALAAISTNMIELEQFMDYLRSRSFRETLLHKPTGNAEPDYTLAPARLPGLFIASSLRPTADPLDLRPDVEQKFESRTKFPLSTTNALTKSALAILATEWPASVEFDALVDRALGQLQRYRVKHDYVSRDRAAAAIGQALLTIYTGSDAMEILAAPSPFTTRVAERPVASAYARLQSTEHEPITTRRHESTQLDETGRAVLRLLDGTRAIADVARDAGRDAAEAKQRVEQLAQSALLI
jgi:SAM-dependent methyltransferase/methyltransferase-like protein